MEIGCPRVYLKDTSVFGGSATAKQLADQVVAKLPNPLQSVIWRQFAVQQIVDPTWANDLPL